MLANVVGTFSPWLMGDFRFEYEIEYEYDFSQTEAHAKHHQIEHQHCSFISTDQQQGKATALGGSCCSSRKGFQHWLREQKNEQHKQRPWP